MKKLQKSLRELVQVNPQAGYLRLFFLVILIFILWSILAVLSALYNPLGNLNLAIIPNLDSSNLALSLLRDILKAYFSTFTLSNLLLFLLIFYISFETLAVFYFRLNYFSTIKLSKGYLSNCAFSIPQIKVFRFPNDFNNSLEENTTSFPEGPLKAIIKPEYALFVDNRGSYKTLINLSKDDDLEILLGHHEKIVDCFNIEPANVLIFPEYSLADVFHSQFSKVELAYSFDLSVEQESTNQLLKLFELCDSKNMRSIIEKIIASEVKATINQYSRNSMGSLPLPNTQIQVDKTILKNKLGIRQYGHKTNALPFNFIKKSEKLLIKRNRKRPIYLSPGLSSNTEYHNDDKLLSISLIEQLNELLNINLQETMKLLFGADIINARILKINEQETK